MFRRDPKAANRLRRSRPDEDGPPAALAALARFAGRLRNRYFLVTDLLLLPIVVYLSFVLRLGGWDLGVHTDSAVRFALLATVLGPLVFYVAGIYSRFWQYASVEDLIVLYIAVAVLDGLVTGVLIVGNLWDLPGFDGLARSIPVIFFMLALAATAIPRLMSRMVVQAFAPRGARGEPIRTIVFGAGDAGILTVRELRRNPELGLEVVGFIDDDPAKQRLRIHGVPVLGRRGDLERMVERYDINRVIIAMPTAPGRVIREIVNLCERAGVVPQTVPGLYELLGGAVHVNQIRNVEIEDLLRREPVRTDLAAVGELLRGKRVLITGAGGSIGGELSRQALRFGPAEIVLLGHGENSVFRVQNELQRLARTLAPADDAVGATQVHAVICDFRFEERLNHVFERHRPEIVFHAGAHKHVPLMELNASEAITNNVLGAQRVLEAARAAGVERFVFVSTDKAVNPTNIMGASKRIAELLVHRAARETGGAYMIVRFGNVLGSRGSVVLSMREQIAAGGPVTVTHPEMRRYFMTIPEAVQLVLQASVLGDGGEVFVFDMGEPVRIVDLAHDLIRLSGFEVGEDIEIVYTGARPGEKLVEELFLPNERYERTEHDKIFIAANASAYVPRDLDSALTALLDAAIADDDAAIRRVLRALVPEYDPRPPVAHPPAPAAVRAETARERQPAPAVRHVPGVDPRPSG